MTDDARMPDVPDLTRICKIGSTYHQLQYGHLGFTFGLWSVAIWQEEDAECKRKKLEDFWSLDFFIDMEQIATLP